MLSAIIVDDEALAVKRLSHLLSARVEIASCHAFMNPWEAYAFVKENPVQLAFLDIAMPDMDGMRLSKLLLHENDDMDIVFVTGYDNYAVQAFNMSALDYLMKPLTEQRLAKTLDKIRKRHRSSFESAGMGGYGPVGESLTEREVRILRLIGIGISNREIADRLSISAETVKSHIKNVYKKLSVNNRIQALQRAKEMKILM